MAFWEWAVYLIALHVPLFPEQISQFFFASSASRACQGLNSACQDGVSPWPWWPVSWCWLVSCSCPVWPTSAAIGKSSRLSSSAHSCSCCPTSGKIRHKTRTILFPGLLTEGFNNDFKKVPNDRDCWPLAELLPCCSPLFTSLDSVAFHLNNLSTMTSADTQRWTWRLWRHH